MPPTISLWVVADGATSTDDERVVCDKVREHIGEIGGPLNNVSVDVYPTGNGAVEVQFSSAQHRLSQEAHRSAALYLRVQGMSVLDKPSIEPVTAPPHRAEKRPAPAPPTKTAIAPLVPAEALLADDVLAIIAEHGSVRPQDIAREIERPAEVIERLLANLAHAGLVNTGDAVVFTLTDAGAAEAQILSYKGGRKAVVDALLAHKSCTTYELCELLGVSLSMVKKTMRLLTDEGMVERGGQQKQSGQGAHPRQLFVLTQKGQQEGPSYVPPNKPKGGWGNPSEARMKIIRALHAAAGLLTPTQLHRMSGVSVSAVKGFMSESIQSGYVKREQVSVGPITYAYELTAEGRTVAERLVKANPELTAEEAVLAALDDLRESRVYRVVVRGDSLDAAMLLEQLGDLDGVSVELVEGE